MEKSKILLWSFLFSLMMNLEIIMSLGIDIENTEIFGSKDQYRIRLIPINTKGQPTFTYARKPASWIAAQKYLLVPKLNSLSYKQVLVSVVLKDLSNQEFKISLIFVYNSQQMFMDTVIYPFDLNADVEYSVKLQPIAPPAANSKTELEMKISAIINEARKDVKIQPQTTFSSLFERFLNRQQILEVLESNNVPAILKLINKVPQANLNCIQQIAYLSEISAIYKQFLHNKKAEQKLVQKNLIEKFLFKFKVQQTGSQNQFKNQNQFQNKDQIQATKRDANNLQRGYISQILDLKQIYDEQYRKSNQINEKKDQIAKIRLQLEKIKQNLDGNQTKIIEIKFLLGKASQASDAQKTLYQNFLALVSKNSQLLEVSRDKLQGKINEQETSLRNLMDQLDDIKNQQKNMQIQITRSQVLLSDSFHKLMKLNQPLGSSSPVPNLYFVINKLNLNLRTSVQIDDLIQQKINIEVLSSTASYLDSFLDQIYYKCYGLNYYGRSDNPQIFVYQISYQKFIDYVQNISQASNGSGLLMVGTGLNSSKVRLQRMNVFSTVWTNQFGQALSVQIAENQNQKAPICQSSQALESHQGLILNISNNVIQVQINGRGVYYILHGACTRLEVCSNKIQRGSLIIWRGRLVSRSIYQSYYSLII